MVIDVSTGFAVELAVDVAVDVAGLDREARIPITSSRIIMIRVRIPLMMYMTLSRGTDISTQRGVGS